MNAIKFDVIFQCNEQTGFWSIIKFPDDCSRPVNEKISKSLKRRDK